METVIGYTLTGLVESSKLLLKGFSYLVYGNNIDYENEIQVVTQTIDSMDLDSKFLLINEYSATPIPDLIVDFETPVKIIQDNLEQIQMAITLHKSKWFTRYRTFDVSIPLRNIETNSKIITERLNGILFRVLYLNNNLHK